MIIGNALPTIKREARNQHVSPSTLANTLPHLESLSEFLSMYEAGRQYRKSGQDRATATARMDEVFSDDALYLMGDYLGLHRNYVRTPKFRPKYRPGFDPDNPVRDYVHDSS